MRLFSILLVFVFLIGCTKSTNENRVVEKSKKQQFLDSIDKKYTEASSHLGVSYKLHIQKEDSIISWPAVCCRAYRVFGYEKPSVNSKKMILISAFTFDNEGNPFQLPLGTYPDISDRNDFELKYIGDEKSFLKAHFIKAKKIQATVYFEKKWARFDKEE